MNRQDAEMMVAVGGVITGLVCSAMAAVLLVLGQPALLAVPAALFAAGIVWAVRLEKKLAKDEQ